MLSQLSEKAALTVSCATFVALYVALIFRVAVLAFAGVVITNVVVVLPDAIPMLLGTSATLLSLLDSVTIAPVSGAGAFNVTVPIEVVPAFTVD